MYIFLQRRDVYGAWEQYLGLEHSDNTPKRSYAVNQVCITHSTTNEVHVVTEATSLIDHIFSQDCAISYYSYGKFESLCMSKFVDASIALVFSLHLVKPWG